MTLNKCELDGIYQIHEIKGSREDREHLYTLGFTDGVKIQCVLIAPGGDPVAFQVRGAVIALRRSQLSNITAQQEV